MLMPHKYPTDLDLHIRLPVGITHWEFPLASSNCAQTAHLSPDLVLLFLP